MKKKIITFGDSWVFGQGYDYKPGMTVTEYESYVIKQTERPKGRFVDLVAEELDADLIDLSRPGSSNQKQFRLANDYFIRSGLANNMIKKPGDKDILVLWGLTSVARDELFDNRDGGLKDVMYHRDDEYGSLYLRRHYDEANEIDKLTAGMSQWNILFKCMGIKVFWYDIFSGFKFDSKTENILLDKSLLQAMLDTNDDNDKTHFSIFFDTSDKQIKDAINKGLSNPISGHPTPEGHRKIADIMTKEIKRRTK